MGEGARSVVPVRLTDRRALLGVGVLALCAHALAASLGLRLTGADFTARNLATTWQLLPLHLLRHDLLDSIVHLPSQPPAFNLLTGIIVHLPRRGWPIAATAVMVVSSVVVAVATLGLLLELGVHRATAIAVVVVLIVADPAEYLYVGFWFYALPTAALVTSTAWAAARWVRTSTAWAGAAYGALAATLVLTNSSYQVYTLAIVSIPILWALRRQWRQVVRVLAAPLLVVVAWYANDLAQFGSPTTSSWVGMNLARATVRLDSGADLRALVRAHVLDPLALVPPFSSLSSYGSLGHHAPTGVPALDERNESPSQPNFNNIAYDTISRRYLTEDLEWIAHRPLRYALNVSIGLRFWLLPAEQWFGTDKLAEYRLDGYTALYDHVVELQPSADPIAYVRLAFFHVGPGLSSVSVTVLVETLLALVALPFAAWRRRRADPVRVAVAAWVWATCALVFALTTLIEVGENNRFRFELGGLPLVAATVAVAWLVAPPTPLVPATTPVPDDHAALAV